LPHPFPPRDRAAGYRYQLSILQAEFSLTQVLDQPVTGRVFFEEVIRENLDIGRPSQVSLIFDRKITGRTPGRFRTRVITDGVVPSLHIDYKNSRIKQYHKLLEALRTETTINDTRDFGIGRRLENLAELRKIGFAANRRLLDVQRIGHDCFIGEAAFQDMQKPVTVGEQRAAALRFADPRVQGLLHVLLLFLLVQGTFRNKDLREHIAPLLGMKPSQLSPGRITYDLRYACTGLSSAFPRRTATASQPRDCGPQSSTRVCITARCALDSPLSHPMRPTRTCPSPDPFVRRKLPSTPGTTKKILRHKT
jgi:hypothetical protein